MRRLSKSGFLKGRQCPRRLWLAANGRAEPLVGSEDAWELREAEGAEVERLAESLFPNALRLAAAPEDEEAGERAGDVPALADRTRAALAEGRPLFQAHLAAGELLAIVDVLEPSASGWFLWEVKASTDLKPLFDWDLAFQVEVARRAGVEVAGAGVIRLDASYVRHGALDAGALLVREDRSAAVAALSADVRREVEAQLRLLGQRDVPDAAPGSRCKSNRDAKDGARPSDCGQLASSGFCGARLPAYWAGRLPYLGGAKAQYVAGLADPSIELLDAEDARWTELQRRVIRAVQRGAPFVDRDALRAELARLVFPVAYVDFEFDPGMAVPRFDGSWPYARVPFQWSLHVQREPGAPLERPEPFLLLGPDDPRRAFLESLLAALPSSGSIVVHSRNAELTVLRELARFLGGHLAEAAGDIERRVFDTVELVRAGYYHPDQQGSYSIKKVAPALAGRGYDDLEVQDGMAAVVAWRRASADGLDAAEREGLRARLLAYCGRDTELMHELVEAVRALAGGEVDDG